MLISGIYEIKSNIKPERTYIGSSQDINGRWQLHLRELKRGTHSNNKLQYHFNKYGKSDLQFSILLNCDKENLILTEQNFIDKQNPWFNICKKAGSHLGSKRSPESCLRMSESKKGNKHWLYGKKTSDSTKLKLSESLKGRTSPWKGHKASQETKIKMSLARIGHPNYLVKHSEETKEKIRKANSGNNSYWFGKHHTDETKKKISETKLLKNAS